ncbi:hypothetical protein [Nonomuraea angiospora]|uniref:hypothetical protein n=1 Tax=Nonomuraea angiospora TaxID=46172 RepID=UPI0029AAB24C|nr:hypothetical protein [Nonomuraea angiospora]MDX3099969.1 hypothetical protein [Nonomuraea angiospora]
MEKASTWLVAALAGVAAAVAAGTLPDVIKGWLGEQRWLLTILCLGAAGIFAGINLWQQRSKGVGIVITLPRTRWRDPWNSQWTRAAIDHARRHTDSCFTVERDIPGPSPEADAEARSDARHQREETLELVRSLVTARLIELSESDPSTPVSIYINAALPDAFELGTKLKFHVHRELRGLGVDQGRQETTTDIVPVVPQRSENVDADFFPAVRLSSRLKDPLTQEEAARAGKLAGVIQEPSFEADPEGQAVALIVHLSDNPQMVYEALLAAQQGCADTTGREETCRAALVIDGGPANIPETIRDFELVVRLIYATWRAWNAARPQYASLQPRLFLAAPASVAFALGWLLGHKVRVVPHPYQKFEAGEPCISS